MFSKEKHRAVYENIQKPLRIKMIYISLRQFPDRSKDPRFESQNVRIMPKLTQKYLKRMAYEYLLIDLDVNFVPLSAAANHSGVFS